MNIMKKINIITQATFALSAGLLFTACSSMHHERSYSRSSTGYETGSYSSANDQSGVYESSGAQSSQTSAATQSSQDRNEVVIPLHEERLNVGKRTVDAGQVTIRKIVKTETVNQPIQLRHETLVIDREPSGGQTGYSYSPSSQSSGTRSSAGWQPGSVTEEQSGAEISANAQTGSPRAREQKEQTSSATVTEPSGAANQSSSSYSSGQTSSASASTSAQPSSQQDQSGTAFQEQTFTIRLQEEQPVIEKNIVQTGRIVARKNAQTQQQNVSQQIRREDVQVDRSGAAQNNVEIRGDLSSGTLNEPSGAQRPMKEHQNSKDSEQQSIDSSGAQHPDSSVNESTDSSSQNRAPTQGQGAQDLKQQPDQTQP
jgi:stress response protein YsnF